MEKHQFKIIQSHDDDRVYQIVDLTDTTLVGITEMLESDDELERNLFGLQKTNLSEVRPGLYENHLYPDGEQKIRTQ